MTGFYEWKAPDSKKGGPKQPYLVYAAQEEGRDVLAMSECTAENSYSEQNGWIGPKPLFMAAIFSIWHKPEDSEGGASAKKEKKNEGKDGNLLNLIGVMKFWVELGWVDLDFGVPPILPRYPAASV